MWSEIFYKVCDRGCRPVASFAAQGVRRVYRPCTLLAKKEHIAALTLQRSVVGASKPVL